RADASFLLCLQFAIEYLTCSYFHLHTEPFIPTVHTGHEDETATAVTTSDRPEDRDNDRLTTFSSTLRAAAYSPYTKLP
ncbi:hypothetical protein DFS33DRAFT_1369248, partial [Desarmillaria ectypa]